MSLRASTVKGIAAFARTLREGRFDIVQTHFRNGNVAGSLAAWLARTPIVISTRRGLPYWRTKSGLHFLRWLDRHATWFVANSEATRDRYVKLEGLDSCRFEVIYNGLNPETFTGMDDEQKSALRKALNVPQTSCLVGIVANLRRVKGLDDFVEAASTVARQFFEAHFIIVGQGSDGERRRLREVASRSGLDERLRLLGPRSDVPQLLQVFDIGVLASHSESFSNSVLEYVAAGLPVVVTDVGGVREVVKDGEQGYIVPPHRPDLMADRLRSLLSHPGGPRAWRAVQGIDARFSLGAMVDGHQRLYEYLAQQQWGILDAE